MNSNEDKQRTDVTKDDNFSFTILEPNTKELPIDKVTSVAVVPFDKQGNIVLALLDRGPDLPGGHMHVGEKTFEETARRETREEAFITLGKLTPACVLQSDYYGTTEDKLTYVVIMTGMVDTFETVVPNEESMGRKIMSIDEFIKAYSAGDKNLMREIINKAQKLLTL